MRLIAVSGAALALFVSGCQPSSADLEEIKANQQVILEKLTALEGAQPAAAAQPPGEDYDKVYTIAVGGSPVLGEPNAPVTIVEYSDFQCPFCARAQPLLMALLEKYPQKVRLVFKHYPLSFHPEARPTALAALAAHEQGKFWEYHDVLFENGQSLDGSKVEAYALEAGLDLDRFKADLEANRAAYDRTIESDMEGGKDADVRGTPTLYVNGRKVRNRSVEGVSAMIDAELEPGTGA